MSAIRTFNVEADLPTLMKPGGWSSPK